MVGLLITWLARFVTARSAEAKIRQNFSIKGQKIHFQKWLPLGPYPERRPVFFVNYETADGKLFRAHSDRRANTWNDEEIESRLVDDPSEWSCEKRDQWFVDPNEIYQPD